MCLRLTSWFPRWIVSCCCSVDHLCELASTFNRFQNIGRRRLWRVQKFVTWTSGSTEMSKSVGVNDLRITHRWTTAWHRAITIIINDISAQQTITSIRCHLFQKFCSRPSYLCICVNLVLWVWLSLFFLLVCILLVSALLRNKLILTPGVGDCDSVYSIILCSSRPKTMFSAGPFVLLVCSQTCDRDHLKTNQPTLMQTGSSAPRGKSTKRSTLGVTRTMVKVKRGQS